MGAWSTSRAAPTTTRRVVVAVVALIAAAASAFVHSAGAQAPSDGEGATPPAGALVVALRTLGQVNALLPDGEVRVLARGLASPSGVAVLADGTVLVAETGGDRVSGFGGRLGSVPELVAEVPQPNGLAVAPNGSVFVTGGSGVGRIDVTGRRVEPFAEGFVSPSGPVVRAGVLYVPDFATGEVTSLDARTGARLATVASGLRSPGGVASADGLPLFISEAAGNSIVRVDPDGGTPSLFATVQGPLQLAVDPPAPSSDDEWTLVAATIEGVVRFDSTGRVVDRTSLPLTVGASVVPAEGAGTPSEGPPSTDGSREPAVLKDEPASSSSPLLLIVILVIVAAAAVGIVSFALARRATRRENEDGGLLPPPPDAPSASVSGLSPCVAEQGQVDRVQAELRLVTMQRDAALDRARESLELASGARDRAMRALEVRTSVQSARLSGSPGQDELPALTWARLSFTTDEGRVAFDAFRNGDLNAAELRAVLDDLGEHEALAQIAEEGRRRLRRDPSVPWPEERQAVRDAISAREELREHERDVETARADADRLSVRQEELGVELAAAEKRLGDCLARSSGQRTAPPPMPADGLPRRPRWAEDAPALDDA